MIFQFNTIYDIHSPTSCWRNIPAFPTTVILDHLVVYQCLFDGFFLDYRTCRHSLVRISRFTVLFPYLQSIFSLDLCYIQRRYLQSKITNHHFKWWSDKPYKGDCVAALKGRSRKPVTWLPLERVNRSLS